MTDQNTQPDPTGDPIGVTPQNVDPTVEKAAEVAQTIINPIVTDTAVPAAADSSLPAADSVANPPEVSLTPETPAPAQPVFGTGVGPETPPSEVSPATDNSPVAENVDSTGDASQAFGHPSSPEPTTIQATGASNTPPVLPEQPA